MSDHEEHGIEIVTPKHRIFRVRCEDLFPDDPRCTRKFSSAREVQWNVQDGPFLVRGLINCCTAHEYMFYNKRSEFLQAFTNTYAVFKAAQDARQQQLRADAEELCLSYMKEVSTDGDADEV